MGYGEVWSCRVMIMRVLSMERRGRRERRGKISKKWE